MVKIGWYNFENDLISEIKTFTFIVSVFFFPLLHIVKILVLKIDINETLKFYSFIYL